MTQIRTHYDNLKVARNAPLEVIKASYKALSQKYHPDKYLSVKEKANAHNIMQIINQSYAVLSDPVKRAKHDEWISKTENKILNPTAIIANNSSLNTQEQKISTIEEVTFIEKFFDWFYLIFEFARMVGFIFAIGFLIWIFWKAYDEENVEKKSVEPSAKSGTINLNDKSIYVRPSKAPNGQPFPNRPAYIKGYPVVNMKGLSTITIENTQNNFDIFGKLIYLGNGQPQAVRHFFIPAGGRFIMRNVTAGNYDIRYKDLSDGQIAKSESFEVQEIDDGTGTQFSNITMTLYKVANGNMQTTPISENEF